MLTDPILKGKVDSLWNKFWSGGLSNPITAIEQMSYLIFLKRLEKNRPPVVPLVKGDKNNGTIFPLVKGKTQKGSMSGTI